MISRLIFSCVSPPAGKQIKANSSVSVGSLVASQPIPYLVKGARQINKNEKVLNRKSDFVVFVILVILTYLFFFLLKGASLKMIIKYSSNDESSATEKTMIA